MVHSCSGRCLRLDYGTLLSQEETKGLESSLTVLWHQLALPLRMSNPF